MDFSPLFLLRQPIYTLSHLDAFALDLATVEPTEGHIETLRVKFLSLIQSKHLLRSLPFSSKTVYNAIAHYEFHASVKIRKKEKQSERAFMKYLQRMTLNCSPLADFAGSQFCDWSDQVVVSKTNYCIELALAQRKEFFDLCYCDQGLQEIMRHRLNPSLRFEGDGFVYIHKSEEGENLVRIETSPEFEKLYQDFKQSDFTFAEFVAHCDFDVNDFLEAQLITPSYPPYSDSAILSKIIASIKDRHQISFLHTQIEGQNFSLLDDKLVLALQSDWINKITAYSKKLKVNLNDKLYPERIFYLNSSIKEGSAPKFDKEAVSLELWSLIQLIDKIQIVEKEKSSIPNDLHLEVVHPTPQYMYDKIKLLPGKGGLYLDLDTDTTGLASSELTDPIGVMLQHTGEGKPNLVNVTTAYGKFFGPALPLASDDVKDLVEAWVGENASDKIALKDASLHSKNKSHAFLKELDNFGVDFHSGIEDRVRYTLKEGVVQDEISNSPIEVVNLGIEQLDSRSPLLRNLQEMKASLPNIPKFISGLQEVHVVKSDNGISMKPRIESKQMILAFQCWEISSKDQFPAFTKDLAADIVAFNAWRLDLEMPRIVSYSFDDSKSNYLDFFNPWSIDIFLRSYKNMEKTCSIKELGIPEKISGIQLAETYFEFSNRH